MSNAIYNLCRPAQMPATAKNVLMAIADRADDTGKCWPSIPGLCEATCFKRTAVIEALKWLESAGIVSVEKSSGRNNRFTIDQQKVVDAVPKTAVHVQLTAQTSPAGGPLLETDQSATRTTTRPGDGLPPVRETDGPVRETDPNHQQPSMNHKATPKARTSRKSRHGSDAVPEGFEQFWQVYPKKRDRHDAMKAFEKLRPDGELLQQMIAVVQRDIRSEQWSKEEGKYIPLPTTWLNKKRWQDEDAGMLRDESKPSWALRAGFANRYEAENAGCFATTASAFANGARVSPAKPLAARVARV